MCARWGTRARVDLRHYFQTSAAAYNIDEYIYCYHITHTDNERIHTLIYNWHPVNYFRESLFIVIFYLFSRLVPVVQFVEHVANYIYLYIKYIRITFVNIHLCFFFFHLFLVCTVHTPLLQDGFVILITSDDTSVHLSRRYSFRSSVPFSAISV